MSQIPIVFIHNGDSGYLKFTLAQAKISNPDTIIYLLGDDTNNNYDFIEHHNMKNYDTEAECFSEIYEHHSVNPHGYELFCFRRWFILKEFMERNKIEQCLYLDSDVMLYTDLFKEQQKLRDFDFTLSNSRSPAFFLINKLRRFKDFCDFVIKCFISQSLYSKLVELHPQGKDVTHVSDMNAFKVYTKSEPDKIGDLFFLIVDNTCYDHNINLSQGFEMDDGIKKVYWINNKPFCKHIDSGNLIRCAFLHFQGRAKRFIKDYFKGELQYLEHIKKWTIEKVKTSNNSTSSKSSDLKKAQVIEEIKNIDGLMQSEKFGEAEIAIEEAIEKYPLSPDLMNLQAELKLHLGELEKAEKILAYILGRWRNHVRSLNTLAVLKVYKKNYIDAKQLLDKVLKLDPSSIDANENLKFLQNELWVSEAREVAKIGNISAAKEILKKVLDIDNNHIEALNDLVAIQITEGQYKEAKENLSLVLQIDKDNEIAKQNLNYLNQKQDLP